MTDRIILVCLPDGLPAYQTDLWEDWCAGRHLHSRTQWSARGDGWRAYVVRSSDTIAGMKASEVFCLGDAQGPHVVAAHMATVP